ncbi:hypothetical protein BGZ76_002613 [Entomortierella beljakovae]|nr:hypothetical protein BGZ76_002613 [Entomortierella beljakovae]
MASTTPATYPFYQIDVFTDKGYYGNPLAVVVVLDPSLPVPTDDQMSRFANWTNLSETTFLLPPTDPTKADYSVRIFTPTSELPFAGHPTIGTCRIYLEYIKAATNEPRKIVQECGVGLVELNLSKDGIIAFAAPPLIKSGAVEEEYVQSACDAMGIDRKEVLDHQWIDNGPHWFGLLLKDHATVLRAKSTSTEKSKKFFFGIVGKYPAHLTANPQDPLFELRAFPHEDLIEEDPVTGSLNAGVAQWLIGSGIAPPSYVASQGAAMGRKGKIYVNRDDTDDSIDEKDRKIWIGGNSPMHKTTPSRTPIYSSAPLSSGSPAPGATSSSLNDASFAIATATGIGGPVSWDVLRKDVRQVELEIESKLTALSKSAVKAGQQSLTGSSSNEGDLEANIEDLLEKLSRLVDAMSAHIDTQAQLNSQAPLTMVHLLQKHRDILHDYTREYRKTRQNVRAARDHAQLLSSVRDDISVFKNGGPSGNGMSASDHLLNERDRIDGSHRLADSALEQAFAAQEDLKRQGSTLMSVNQKINNVAAQLPSVGQLIGKIQSRKNRDNVILSCVIGSCVVGVLYLVM